MRVVILAGGRGTRISEESDTKPKPMIDVGGRPLLWHIMKIYAAQGYDDFLIAAGYKADVIKRFFYDEAQLSGDLYVDSLKGELMHFAPQAERWRVRIVNTGLDTNTGGRILRLKPHIGDEPFMVTYGDGVADVRLDDVVACHKRSDALATITAVRPPASAASASTATRSRASPRSRRPAKVGSMAASPCWSRNASTISRRKATRPRSNTRFTNIWCAKAASAPTAMKASGSASTRCANCAC